MKFQSFCGNGPYAVADRMERISSRHDIAENVVL